MNFIDEAQKIFRNFLFEWLLFNQRKFREIISYLKKVEEFKEEFLVFYKRKLVNLKIFSNFVQFSSVQVYLLTILFTIHRNMIYIYFNKVINSIYVYSQYNPRFFQILSNFAYSIKIRFAFKVKKCIQEIKEIKLKENYVCILYWLYAFHTLIITFL